jgi:membrane protein
MKHVDQRLNDWLWSNRKPHSRAGRAGRAAARGGYALIRDLAAGDLSLRAMSLVYTTMLATVPLLAFSFSVLKGLGVHRELEPLLLNFLEPLDARAAQISDSIIAFVDNVSGAGLATLSLVILLYTALSLAQKLETSFNFVWRVDRPRSVARRFSEYLSVLLVGPVLMSIAMGLIAAIESTTAMNQLRAMPVVGSWIAGLGALTPYLIVISAFTLLYLFVPNTRVRLRPAALGGVFAGLIWVGSGSLFTRLVVDASRYDAIYSGFAIVIMTMLWLYFSWLILLLGTQLTFYLQNPEYLRYGQRTPSMSNGLRERLAFAVMLLVGRDFADPQHGWRVESLAARIRIPLHLLDPVIGALTQEKLLTETKDSRLVPAKDPHRVTLLEIAAAVRGHGLNRTAHEWRTVQSLADRMEQALAGALGHETLGDLIARDIEAEAEQEADAAGHGETKLESRETPPVGRRAH